MRWRAEAGRNGTEVPTHRVTAARDISNVQELPRPTLVSRPGNLPTQEAQPSLSKVNEARKLAEAEAILAALQSSLWNRKRAALLLNIDYKALLYKMKKLGIGEKRAASCG
jgi:DNA-binding NtrC family response regulator